MSDPVARYILDGTDDDLRRLLTFSQTAAEAGRTAFHRTGVQPGWSAIDCGCGPIGGLAVLAELVGPTGQVVGVDFNEPAVRQARSLRRVATLLRPGGWLVVQEPLRTPPFDLTLRKPTT